MTTRNETVQALRKALGSEAADLLLDHAAQCTTAETLTVDYDAALADMLHHVQGVGHITTGNIDYYLAIHCPDIKNLLKHRQSMPDTIYSIGADVPEQVYAPAPVLSMEDQIKALVMDAQKKAQEYAAVYNCSDDLRPTIYLHHFVYLVNQIYSTLIKTAEAVKETAHYDPQ